MKFELKKSTLRLFAAAAATLLPLCGCRTEVMTARENLDPAERDVTSDYPGKEEMIARQTPPRPEKTPETAAPEKTPVPEKTAQTPAIEPLEAMSNEPIKSPATPKTTKNSGQQTAGKASAKGGSYVVVSGDSLGRIAHRNGTTVKKLAAYNSLNPAKPIRVGQVLQLPPADYKAGDKAVKNAKGSEKPAAVKTTDAKQPALPADGLYIVKPGDSVERIARRLKVKRAALYQANGLNEKSVLRIGQKLIIPGSSADKGATVSGPAETPGGSAVSAPKSAVSSNPENDLDTLVSDLEKSQNGTVAAPAPVPAPGAPAAVTASESLPLEVLTDTSVADFAARNGVTVEKLKQANAAVWPADGILKAGTLLVMP